MLVNLMSTIRFVGNTRDASSMQVESYVLWHSTSTTIVTRRGTSIHQLDFFSYILCKCKFFGIQNNTHTHYQHCTLPNHDRNPPQDLMDTLKRHVILIRELSGTLLPKHHLMIHLTFSSDWHGNPVCYATWLDESLNKQLKMVLRNCHQSCFETTAFAKMQDVLSRASKRQRFI